MAAGASDDRSRGAASVRADAEAIFRAALDRVDPAAMVERAIKIDHLGELVARTELEEIRYDLGNF
ncbi:MAG: hypothetical protein Q8M76_10010, partial [Spirochaetaceae bacterium]|nr:hypothetical protein [Spirochaetaceae bacterium]